MTFRARPTRYAALDLLRAAAVISMIQGHTFTALLDPAALGSPTPRWYTLLHGLTAPLFLLSAGIAYGVSRVRDGAATSSWRERFPASVPGLRRAALLLALGTYMQLPGGSLLVVARNPALRERTFAVGPLQLIAACIVWTELMRVLFVRAAAVRVALACSTLLTLLAAPYVWSWRASVQLPLLPGTWLDGLRGSHFPLLPWAAFFGLGLLLAPALAREARLAHAALWLAASALVMGLALGFHVYGGPHGDSTVYWHAGSAYFAFRAGACTLFLGSLIALDALWLRGRETAPLAVLAQHSLTAYVVHLVLLYGSPFSRGLARHFAPSPLDTVAVLTVLLLLVTWMCCYGVQAFSARRRAAQTARGALAPSTQGS